MKILTDRHIRMADHYTMEHEPITSLALMERASLAIARHIAQRVEADQTLMFLIGKGNNGGDGLAVARLLHKVGYHCRVILLFDRSELSQECCANLDRLPQGVEVTRFDGTTLPNDPATIWIDAMLGTGVQGDVHDPVQAAICALNRIAWDAQGHNLHRVVSIDLPSGMLSEFGNAQRTLVKASTTLTLEFPKLALLLPEAGNAAGRVEVLPIGLDQDFMAQSDTPYRYTDPKEIAALLLPRQTFDHKGRGGHALLVCGSHRMPGAAVLATCAALRSGCGLVTTHLPESERTLLHITAPEALVDGDPEESLSTLPHDMTRYNAIGVGCGIGQDERSVTALAELMRHEQPMVFDADALNLIASHRSLATQIPQESILTPHIGELRRLIGPWRDDSERLDKTRQYCAANRCYMVSKGAHTMICTPQGSCYFNSTGNAGMAKGGSGDVLTGLVTALLARGYSPLAAARVGVFMHGMAGDYAATALSCEAMRAGDLIDFLPKAWKHFE